MKIIKIITKKVIIEKSRLHCHMDISDQNIFSLCKWLCCLKRKGEEACTRKFDKMLRHELKNIVQSLILVVQKHTHELIYIL